MPTDTAPDFDLGPLTWVQGEIDQALSRGLDALAVYKASPREITSLKHARSHVHQAAGAIQMVGLDAVTAYTDELERQLNRVEELPLREAQDVCDLIDRSCRKLKIFLDELVGGAPPVPLKLFPDWAQTALFVQPFAGLVDIPFRIYFGDLTGAHAWAGLGLQAFWTVILAGGGWLALNRVMARLQVQGG